MSIDQLPASEALGRLEEAREQLLVTFNSLGGRASFESLVTRMRSDGGFAEYDTRLAMASLGAVITDEGVFALAR
ncbi:hypothetical protein HP550_17585 [Cellulomonas humilata]|uniref:Uncharacterized protein n=1 Tax=Cellulomonas humilata TaxID=144055 RepID=A0A7Y6A3H4_9CELL|nr:hypothetical protein [Cellulomonas humilata]NUU19063.1 hypothetical protein [Cellulomonas humilata]